MMAGGAAYPPVAASLRVAAQVRGLVTTYLAFSGTAHAVATRVAIRAAGLWVATMMVRRTTYAAAPLIVFHKTVIPRGQRAYVRVEALTSITVPL